LCKSIGRTINENAKGKLEFVALLNASAVLLITSPQNAGFSKLAIIGFL
jgi:hypothetical protein